MFKHKKAKKIVASVFLALFLFVGSLTILSIPKKTQAFPAEVTFTVETFIDRIAKFVQNSLVTAGLRALMNTGQYITQRVAHDAAVWIGSGGQGQGPLFEHRDFGEYMIDLGGAALGEFVGDVNRDWAQVFDLCNPPSPQLKVNFKLGLLNDVQPQRKPKCDIYTTYKNWQRAINDIERNFLRQFEPKEFLGMIQNAFEPGGNDIGMYLSLADNMRADMAVRIQQGTQNRGVKDADWNDYADKISKRIWTPRTVVSTNFKKKVIDSPAQQQNTEWLATYITGAVRPETYPAAMLATFTSTFINTLGSQLQKRIMEGLFKQMNPSDNQDGNYAGTAYIGRRAVEASFAELRRPQIVSESNVDYVNEFAACPEQYAGINNCVIDGNFQTAILQYNSSGEGITVQEAIDSKYLNGNWPIYPKNHIENQKNNGLDCFRNGYCYRNLVRLRRARILPVGWEMVAQICDRDVNPAGVNCSNSTPPTLQEVVDNFDNCNSSDPRSIFCHLIDPDWVLKAPATQCLARVSGPLLEGQGVASRQDVCVDDKSCILEDDRGVCKAYGYCTREKNIWRFGGEVCEARYDSCRTYADVDGNELSVIDKTIDPGVCNASNAGCKWYSAVKTQVGATLAWSNASSDKLYLNSQVKECDEGQAGCTELIRVAAGGTNILRNSGFESNEDTVSALPDGWAAVGAASSVQYSNDSTKSNEGQGAVRPGASGISQQVNVLPKQTYNLSAFVLNTSVTQGDAILEVQIRKGTQPVKTISDKLSLPNSALHTRITLPFVVDTALDAADNALIVLKQSSGGAAIWFDSVMFEQLKGGEFLASSYSDYGSKNTVNMKVAPDYLGCYKEWGSFTTAGACATAQGNWDAATQICSAPTSCAVYAGWCSRDEVGCNLFKPVIGDSPAIAGIPTGDDYCPAECSGYGSFIQKGTLFEDGGNLDFLIPNTATQCSVDVLGCDEFTNLEAEQSGRAESKEYYSFLRQCKKPDGSCKTFYTWEGSDTQGYQLRTFSLESQGIAPKITGTTADDCNEAKFKTGAFPDCRQFYHVDAQGKTHISYATLSRTKICSDDCTTYRRTLTKGKTECETYGGVWDANQNSCIYMGLPQASRQCTQQAAGCREYKGNTGNNIRTAFFDDFEEGTNSGWVGGQNSNVAIPRFTRSVWNRLSGRLTKDITQYVNKGNSYTLTFWARSRGTVGATINVEYSNSVGGNVAIANEAFGKTGAAQINDTWQKFTVGPVVLWDENAGNVDKVELHFSNVAQNELYIDKVQLQEITDRVFLVKNSWNTPISCDNSNITPFGRLGQNNPSRDNPQAQLNCTEYKDKAGQSHFLKTFTRLCRDEAVGCEEMLDTQNTESAFGARYNVLCNATTGTIANGVCTLNTTGDTQPTCKVPSGENSCYVAKTSLAAINQTCNSATGTIANSICTLNGTSQSCLIAAGNSSCNIGGVIKSNESEAQVSADEVIYLVNDEQHHCDADGVGCQEIALPTLNANNQLDTTLPTAEQWTSKYVLNRPDTYETILCNGNELFCQEYSGTDNAKRYFKDPGKRTCEFRTNVKITQTNGLVAEVSGWFKTHPSGPAPEPCYPNFVPVLDGPNSTDTPKDAHYKVVGSWDVLGEQQYFLALRDYKAKYDGWVGLCPETQNLCTLFVDPRGTADPTKGDKDDISHYFYINDDNVDSTSCNGQVSLKEGCVLFDDTSRSEKTYHALASYKRSTDKNNEPVNPVNCEDVFNNPAECADYVGQGPINLGTAPSDTNRVIKVTRDRTCGEWLTCQSGTRSKENGKPIEICSKLTRCTQYNASKSPSRCDRALPTSFERLTVDRYQKRGGENYSKLNDVIGWTDREYSGYSIPNYFSLDTLVGVSYEQPNTQKIENRLFHDTRNLDQTSGAYLGVCSVDSDCKQTFTDNSDPNNPKTFSPVCVNSRCVVNVNGTKVARQDQSKGGGLNVLALNQNSPRPSCRAYPERESPFMPVLGTVQGLGGNLYSGANFCVDCQLDTCDYRKVTYGGISETRYYAGTPEKAICVGGPFAGTSCDPSDAQACKTVKKITEGGIDSIITSGGECQRIDKRQLEFNGWRGYCLERDYRGVRNNSINQNDYDAPCITWMPVRYMTGLRNLHENYLTAGFNKTEELSYCAETTLVKDVYASAVRCANHAYIGCDNEPSFDKGVAVNCREDIQCPDGHFVVYGGCNTWGNIAGQDEGYCATAAGGTSKDRCPYQCVPMGGKHAIGGSLTLQSPISANLTKEVKWNVGDSCWDTAKQLAQNTTQWVETFGVGAAAKKSYFAYISQWNIAHNASNYGFAPLRRDEIPKPTLSSHGRTIFDDCVLPNVDLLDNVGKVYAQDGVEGEFKLACKTRVQVTAENKKKANSGQGTSEWLNKAWTNRVAYDSLTQIDELGNPVQPVKIDLKGAAQLTYRIPNIPYSFTTEKFLKETGADKSKKKPLTDFVNVITGCRNTNVNPTYFGVGLRRDDGKDGTICGDTKKYGVSISPIDNDQNKGANLNQNQLKLKSLFDDDAASFHAAEFVYNRYGLKPSDVDCSNDSKCQVCVKDSTRRLACASDAECTIKTNDGTSLSFGRCFKDPKQAKGGCEYPYSDFGGSQEETYCGKRPQGTKISDTPCICANDLKGSCDPKNAKYTDKKEIDKRGLTIIGLCKGSNNTCNTNSDCYGKCVKPPAVDTSSGTIAIGSGKCSYTPVNEGEVKVDVIGERPYDNDTRSINTATERLQQLFARVYEVWHLGTGDSTTRDKILLQGTTNERYAADYPQFQYDEVSSEWDPDNARQKPFSEKSNPDKKNYLWDVSDGSNPQVVPVPPTFAADISGGTGEGTEGSVSVNGNFVDIKNPQSQPIEIEEGISTILSFYAWADKNQMPLRKVMVAWGKVGAIVNGVQSQPDMSPALEGRYKNRRSLCNPAGQEGLTGKGFGGYEGACDTDPFIYEHMYVLRKLVKDANGKSKVEFACEELGGRTINQVPRNAAFGTESRKGCLFTVQVHLADNWGWCTGPVGCANTAKHPNTNVQSIEGCYNYENDLDLAGENYCNSTKPGTKAWKDVAQIIVYEFKK